MTSASSRLASIVVPWMPRQEGRRHTEVKRKKLAGVVL
jgi:hypothetical protein